MVFKFTCEYIGTDFCGFQRQKKERTVQEVIENALSKYFNRQIHIVASGRTDTGVHAFGQVCSFADAELNNTAVNPFKICSGINAFLPADVSVKDFTVNPEIKGAKSFNARTHAKAKTYIYKCYISRFRSVLRDRFYHRLYDKPDIESMRQAAKFLVGTHDFTSFASADTDKTNFERTIHSLEISKNHDELIFSVRGNSFLRNMVRIIVGTLLEVGFGKIAPDEISSILKGKNRKLAGSTAPAKGLCLQTVEY